VIWKDPAALPLSFQDCKRFESIMSEKVVYLSALEDKVIWVPSKSGNFNIKEGYNILQQ
jgi:hypothetical protein